MSNLDLHQADFKGFGFRELALAGEMLKKIGDDGFNNLQLDLPVSVGFNPNSGNVFLTDEDFNCVMENEDGNLQNWLFCGNCGFEDFDNVFFKDTKLECPKCKTVLN